VPDPGAGVARVAAEPALAGTQVDRTVALSAGPCTDWRSALKASFEAGQTRFAGSYAATCGELAWPVADPQPATYEHRLVQALWQEMGGVLRGAVRDGPAPLETRPSFELRSPALAEVVRDINKYSNNVMAQQLFLTLALHAPATPRAAIATASAASAGDGAASAAAARAAATPDAARETLLRWVEERSGEIAGEVVLDNGSGLSRTTRISALRLARLLQWAWDSPIMSELMSSLPVSGLDGTMRRSRATAGRAHLKTGSLRDVAGVAGYVLSNSGRRYVLVAIVNHPNANAARPALDAIVQWALRDAPAR
jgi:D-alanyl-D-alanine carboxypeptidase/D-alanyl-D-alanine-endopeptidase (penicillin-binding protein 4)